MSRFSKQAELYAEFRPDYPEEMYQFIFEHLSARQKAWDCATGSGQVAKVLADHFESVVATDISEEQIAFAPEKENIEYRIAPAENSGLQANHFNLITVAQAIHWFDFERFYEEVRRVAKDEAVIAVIGYGMVRINEEVDPIIDSLYEEAFGAHFDKNRTFLDNDYETIPFPFSEIQVPSFTHTLVWSLDQLEGYFNSWSAIQKMKDTEGYNPAQEAMGKIRDKMSGNHTDVKFPVFMRLGTL